MRSSPSCFAWVRPLPLRLRQLPLHTVAPFSPITGEKIGAPFANPETAAVDESTGNIFVGSGAFGGNVDNSVDILSAEGGIPSGVASPFKITGLHFENGEFAVVPAVDNSAASPNKGALYVPDEGTVVKKYVRNPVAEKYELADELSSVPPMQGLEGVAVDKDGNVYAASYIGGVSGFGTITKFSATGEELTQFEATEADSRPKHLAIDSAGDLFVNTGGHKVFKYPANPLGEIEATNFEEVPVAFGQPQSVALDRSSNTLFVGYAGDVPRIGEYDATSLVEKGEFKVPSVEEGVRLAVNSAAGWLYASDELRLRQVAVLSLGGATLADAGTTEPTAVSATRATLNGVVNPQGLAVGECKFELGATTLPCEGALPTDSSPHLVTALASGLGPNTSTRYKLVVNNANGSNSSGIKLVGTAGIAKTAAASSITPSEAMLNGIVRPEGSIVTECRFEIGLTSAYGESLPCNPAAADIPSDFEPHSVSATAVGLIVGTTYHYRIVVNGGLGSENGEDRSFTALGPSVKGISFSKVTETGATLESLVNPRGEATVYHFEYGSAGPCASEPCVSVPSADASAGSGTSDVLASQAVGGLKPATTYYFRIVLSSADGTGHSPESTFTTYDAPPTFGRCPVNDGFRGGAPSAKLSDCRAYEQATPVDKNGNDASGQQFKVQASLSGDGLTSQTKGGLPGGEGGSSYPLYLSHRTPRAGPPKVGCHRPATETSTGLSVGRLISATPST